MNNNKQSLHILTCSIIPTNISISIIFSTRSSTNLITPIFTTAEDAVVVVVFAANVDVAAATAMDFENASIVGHTGCVVTMEESSVTLLNDIKLMQLLRIAWGAIHIM